MVLTCAPLFPPSDLDRLAVLLGYANYKALAAFIYPALPYRTFSIPKKSSGTRTISAPFLRTKNLQRKVLAVVDGYGTSALGIKRAAHGFVAGRSILTNAQAHVGKQFIFNIDLQDFFPSIHFGRVRGLFMAPPFGFSPACASVLAHICSHERTLPQGAPTSPALSNLICRKLDRDLQNLARTHRATYTRYCDDITFSFTAPRVSDLPNAIVHIDSDGVANPGHELSRLISNASFHINPSKTRLRTRGQRMDVTGLTVNQAPNVRRRYVDEIRGMIHAWERYGLANASDEMATRSLYTRHLRTKTVPPFEHIVRGKLLFLAMVKGRSSPVYARLAHRFNALVASESLPSGLRLPISSEVNDLRSASLATFRIDCCADVGSPPKVLCVSGTGFVFAGGYIVTCEHVLAAEGTASTSDGGSGTVRHEFADSEIEIRDTQRRRINARVVFRCRRLDLAVLKLDEPKDTYPHFREAISPVSTQQKVHVLGFPNAGAAKGLSCIEGHATTNLFPKSGVQYFEVSQMIRQGNSGGPVVDSNFRVLGIAVEGAAQDDGDNGVVHVQHLLEVLETIGVDKGDGAHSATHIQNLPEELQAAESDGDDWRLVAQPGDTKSD